MQKLVLSEKDFRKISNLVHSHCGINLHEGKKELVRARLAKLLRKGNFSTFSEYMEHVHEDKSGTEFSKLINAISTNLTSFFREKQHFDYLQKEFLPQLAKQKQKNGNRRIRAWSAGCSSGEEPYSIAITLIETTRELGDWDVKVLATDVSTRMLETARKGFYEKERIIPVWSEYKDKYLTAHKIKNRKVFEVNENLRKVVIFQYLNLIKQWPIKGPVDFIFCRNVMIYFDKQTQQRLVNRFWDLLNSGGLLFTGHSESLTGIEHKFHYIKPTIYWKP